jgi:glycosyltransferase involved in cell wall biosynthesis
MKINFITNIPLKEYSGGFSGMNLAAYETLQELGEVHYAGPINPPSSAIQKLVSKAFRLIGVPGAFYFFSNKRLKQIASDARNKCRKDATLDFFHGFTPWIDCQLQRPYIAWSDCSFQDYISIFHNPAAFSQKSINRICSREQRWLSSAEGIFLSSEWAIERIKRDYNLDAERVANVGIFGAMEPPMADTWAGGRDFYFVSTDYKQKNGPLCRNAMEYVWHRYPDAKLKIIGAPPPKHDMTDERVTYEGFFRKSVPSELVAYRRHLSNAFALVHPTKADTTAMIVIEAAFFGCPAITVDDFALREVTPPENSNLLLKRPLSAETIANKMLHLLERPDIYGRVRESSRLFATPKLTIPAFKGRMQSEIMALLDKCHK